MASKDVQVQDNTAQASESILLKLAVQLGECKSLGRQLRLSEEKLEYIEIENKGYGQKEMNYQTLLRWKREFGQQATIGCLAKALRNAGRRDLAVFVMQGDQVILNEVFQVTKRPGNQNEHSGRAVSGHLAENVSVLRTCICGNNSYKELKSHSDESLVVSLLCNSCPAEWFPTTDSTQIHLVRENNKYSYKIPCKLDLSKLKHEDVKDVNELRHGDHIAFRRAPIYDHHAIFLQISENGNIKVIHWTGPPIDIKCEDISFPRGGVRRVQYPESDPVHIVVARAYDMLYNSSQGYDLASNNCESLATFCKIGKAFSIQGDVVGDVLPFLPKVLKNFKYLKYFSWCTITELIPG